MKKTLCLFLLHCLTMSYGNIPSEPKFIDDGKPTAKISLLPKEQTPVIEGAISDKEWSRAIKLSGFARKPASRGLVRDQTGFVYLSADKDYIYVAVLTSTPNDDTGGGLRTMAKKRDSDVSRDDSVEVAIVSDRDPVKVYHFILNSQKTLFDRTVNSSNGIADTGYNIKNLKVESRVGSLWWHLEMRIPRSQVGSPKDFIKINVARNWTGIGSSAISATTSHTNPADMIKLDFTNKATPVLRLNELGAPWNGIWQVECEVDNVTPANPAVLSVAIHSHGYLHGKPSVLKAEKFESKKFTSAGKISFKKLLNNTLVHSLSVVLTDGKNGEIIAKRVLYARKQGQRETRYPYSATREIPGGGTIGCRQYPGYNKAILEIFPGAGQQLKNVRVICRNPEGKIQKVQAKPMRELWCAEIAVGPTPGKYSCTLEITDKSKKVNSFKDLFTLEKREFVWENNKLGCEKIIIPPFEPIKVDGNTVSTIQRQHKINGWGLFDSVQSKGRELLSSAIGFDAVIDGKPVTFDGKSGKITVNDGGHDATLSGVAQSGSFSIKNSAKMEYDGLLWNRLDFDNPQGQRIDRLTLKIPLKAEEAKLFHAVADTIRKNPAGSIPAGNGVVWDGSTLPRAITHGHRMLHPQFVPYFWFGTEERGICFMMNSSFGTRLKKNQSAVRLVRREKEVVLEVDLINEPTVVKSGEGPQFGLLATPVKPLMPEFRRIINNAYGIGVQGMDIAHTVNYRLLGFVGWFKQPWKQDYSLVKAIAEHVVDGRNSAKVRKIADDYFAKYDPEIQPVLNRFSGVDGRKNYWDYHFDSRKAYYSPTLRDYPAGKRFPMRYSDPRLITPLEETARYFLSEWAFSTVRYVFGHRSFPVRTNLDFMMYCYDLDMKNGIGAVYLDDMFIIPSDNVETVARVDRFGEVHADCGLLQLRELVKRIATLQHQYKVKPRYIQIHMTNALLLPCFSWGTSQLGWEDHYGELEFQDRYAVDNILAINLGAKLGAESVALDGIHRNVTSVKEWKNGKFLHLTRTNLAMTLPFDVKIKRRLKGKWSGYDWNCVSKIYTLLSSYGCWSDQAVFVPCYADDGALGKIPAGIMAASYRLQGKVAVILANTGEAETVQLKPDYAKLSLPAGENFYNAETGQIAEDNRVLIPRRDFMVLFSGKK